MKCCWEYADLLGALHNSGLYKFGGKQSELWRIENRDYQMITQNTNLMASLTSKHSERVTDTIGARAPMMANMGQH